MQSKNTKICKEKAKYCLKIMQKSVFSPKMPKYVKYPKYVISPKRLQNT